MQDKIAFLQNNLIAAVNSLKGDEVPKWGKMSAQHMIEHLSSFFALSYGKLKMDIVSPPEKIPLLQDFIMSDKLFRENTKAPVLPEDPLPLQHSNIENAKAEFNEAVAAFFHYFETDSNAKTAHPVFGELDYKLWVHLHYKHVVHHLTQFYLL